MTEWGFFLRSRHFRGDVVHSHALVTGFHGFRYGGGFESDGLVVWSVGVVLVGGCTRSPRLWPREVCSTLVRYWRLAAMLRMLEATASMTRLARKSSHNWLMVRM